MPDNVLLGKARNIEFCLDRIETEYSGHESELATDLRRQDAIVLNLQRACQAAIDIAVHFVRTQRLGLPDESREAFALIAQAGIIDEELCADMQAMVGFRNIAIHRYQEVDLSILRSILDDRLDDLRRIAQIAVRSATAD